MGPVAGLAGVAGDERLRERALFRRWLPGARLGAVCVSMVLMLLIPPLTEEPFVFRVATGVGLVLLLMGLLRTTAEMCRAASVR